jgi:hypothetical protein
MTGPEPTPSSSSTSATARLRHDLTSARDDLARLRDELRVQLNLGKKEALDLWRGVEPALRKAERKLEEAVHRLGDDAEAARLQAHLGIAEVKSNWPDVERAVSDLVDDVKHASQQTRTSLDTARVRAHLAAMEAQTLGERAVTGLQKATEQLDRQSRATLEELKQSLAQLRRRLPR